MSFPQPAPIKAFAELWTISEPGEFVYQLSRFISHKKSTRKAPLSPAEYTFQLLMDMQPTIEMEGFQDLFFQAYSLADCVLVESGLREIGAHQLADLFAEAKSIYTRRKTDLTEAEYQDLTLDIPEPDGSRFDEIGEQFLAGDSQLYEFGERLADFAQAHKPEFSA